MIALLTHSRLQTWRSCPKLEFFKYEQGYRPAEDVEELSFGALVHKGLEAWWLAVKDGVPEDQWIGLAVLAMRTHAVGTWKVVDPYAIAKAEVLMAGYHARWAADAALYEVLGVEEQFEFALVNPETGGRSTVWRVAGKLDVRVRRRSDGVYGIIEHKTSSEAVDPGSTYFARLRLDAQVSIYFDGAASLGPAPEFCLYDVIGKPTQRPYKATPPESRKFTAKGTLYANQHDQDETPDEYQVRVAEAVSENPDKYFVRGEVVRLESELIEARAEIWQQGAILRENANAGRHPRNPGHCTAYGRICPFFGVCTGEASLEDTRLFTRTNDVHPELAGLQTNQSKEEIENGSNANEASGTETQMDAR